MVFKFLMFFDFSKFFTVFEVLLGCFDVFLSLLLFLCVLYDVKMTV